MIIYKQSNKNGIGGIEVNDFEFEIIEASDGVQAVIDRLNLLARSNAYVFRGYGKQDELFPNIIRGKDFSNVENILLHDFEKYGSNYFSANTPIDFMSYAQHFGLPTRLLDFTRNPFIALSFALYMPKGTNYKDDDDRVYYYIRYASLNDNLCVPSIPLNDDVYNVKFTRTDSLAARAAQCIDSVTDLFSNNILHRSIFALDGFKDTIDNTYIQQEKIRNHAILFVDPNQSNQRIIMQQGLFMFPYTLDKNEHLRIINKHSKVIKIHKDLRNELIDYLDILGYNTFRLMPDLSSICEAVKRRVIDERLNKKDVLKKKLSTYDEKT